MSKDKAVAFDSDRGADITPRSAVPMSGNCPTCHTERWLNWNKRAYGCPNKKCKQFDPGTRA